MVIDRSLVKVCSGGSGINGAILFSDRNQISRPVLFPEASKRGYRSPEGIPGTSFRAT